METWSAAQLAANISLLGPDFAAAWAGSSLTGRNLAEAPTADVPNLLRDAGVTSLGIRKKLARAIEAWKLVATRDIHIPTPATQKELTTSKPENTHIKGEKRPAAAVTAEDVRSVYKSTAPVTGSTPTPTPSKKSVPPPPTFKRRRIAPQFLGAAKEERISAKPGPLEDWTARKEDALNRNIIDTIGYARKLDADAAGEAVDEFAPDASSDEDEQEMERILNEEEFGAEQ
ncbi:hypothetical protein HDU87_002629 [Geranomyces variabilis]|uniref:Uncharacterized protein n=1 Tax=Geranomyces variabilis TaxID=109894 RepID=A0AAD5TRA5_9FUNG|nr:hypothetical protein HDU87_002629 [Geranomyces variabilis]